MIKKLNVALVVAFAVMLAFKGLKNLKENNAKKAALRQDAAAQRQEEGSQLAPCVYYGFWSGYTLENPISNRNGVLLDIVRAVFPKATFQHIHGEVKAFADILRNDPNAVVVGFGTHPLLKEFPSAPTPLMTCPLVLMTLRTNPWTYKGVSSLNGLRIVADEAFLDYKVIRDLHDRVGAGSKFLRLLPASATKSEMAEMVERGEADAFVMADLMNLEGMALDGVVSVRFLRNFRKSKVIANDGTLLYASGKDPGFAKRVVAEYEEGVRRIEKNGMRRRIFEYYGISETEQNDDK